MTQTSHNRVLVDHLRAAFAAFEAGDLDVDAIQAALQQAMTLLERDGFHTSRAVQLAEADVEEIRFTRAGPQQRPEVLRVVRELLASLPGSSDASAV